MILIHKVCKIPLFYPMPEGKQRQSGDEEEAERAYIYIFIYRKNPCILCIHSMEWAGGYSILIAAS